MRKPQIKKSALEPYNRFTAYFLGLVYADGCIQELERRQCWVSKGKPVSEVYTQYRTTITMVDKEILDGIRMRLGVRNLLYKHKSDAAWELNIYGEWLVKLLKGYGVVGNKSKAGMGLDRVPEVYFNSFLCGFYDGDGSLHPSGGVRIYANKAFLEEIEGKLKRLLPGMTSSFSQCKQSKDIWGLIFRKECSKVLSHWMHRCTPLYLERKVVK